MIKKQFQCLAVVSALIFSGTAAFVYAEQPVVLTVNNADGQSLEKLQAGLRDVKESAVDLINAKDEQNLSFAEQERRESELRLEVLKKVIILAVQEAEDIVKQLKDLEPRNRQFALRREHLLEKFEVFLKFYEEQKQNLENSEEIGLISVKDAAQSLKEWREKNYSPVFEEATDLLLLHQQKFLLELAEKRYQKIDSDIKKLKKFNARVFVKIEKTLEQAADALNEARSLGKKAEEEMFWSVSKNAISGAAPTVNFSSVPPLAAGSSSLEVKTENQNPSIKNLVGQSLNKIKDAYRIFIEMSNSVKKLLI